MAACLCPIRPGALRQVRTQRHCGVKRDLSRLELLAKQTVRMRFAAPQTKLRFKEEAALAGETVS